MSLHYENLDEHTRQFMLEEVERDISQDKLYISPRLNELGQQNYPQLLKEAVKGCDDAWLANQLRQRMKSHHGYTKTGKPRKVPVNAPDTLAEGEFNRFYMRGLSLRAIKENMEVVEIYRGRASRRPRPESEAMIGQRILAQALLTDLREAVGKTPVSKLPSPNSGLTVRLVSN